MNKRKLRRFFLSFKELFVIFSAIIFLANFVLFSANPQKNRNSVSVPEAYTSQKSGIFLNEYVPVPTLSSLVKADSNKKVLGAASPSNKHISIDLTNQRLYAYEKDKLVYNFRMSSGKWDKTPTGDFKIWTKYKSTLLSGGNKTLKTYYYLPDVPYAIYFYNKDNPESSGLTLHGTYWHENFGHPMSNGSIDLKTEDAEKLFYWTDPVPGDKNETKAIDEQSTPIAIYGKAPNE